MNPSHNSLSLSPSESTTNQHVAAACLPACLLEASPRCPLVATTGPSTTCLFLLGAALFPQRHLVGPGLAIIMACSVAAMFGKLVHLLQLRPPLESYQSVSINNPGQLPSNTDLLQILVSTLWILILSVTRSSCL